MIAVTGEGATMLNEDTAVALSGTPALLPVRRNRNVRKLLARLHPKVMGFRPGAGGVPMETAIDVAAAAGMAGHGSAPHQLAVLALCLRWWPGMFEGPNRVIGYRTLTHKRTQMVAGQAMTRTWQEQVAIEGPSETAAFQRMASLVATCIERRILRDYRLNDEWLNAALAAQIAGLPAPRKPKLHGAALDEAMIEKVLAPAFLARWARVVIDEYRHPNHCQSCSATNRPGEVPRFLKERGQIVGVKWEVCEACTGEGVTAWSAHRRAAAVTIGVHPFRNYLAPHHNGALALLRTLEDRGASALLQRLGR